MNADERLALDLAKPGDRPFDAWAVVDGDPEPVGSHATPEAALAAVGVRDGCVTTGMTFLRWNPGTTPEGKRVLRAALKGHGTNFDRHDESAS